MSNVRRLNWRSHTLPSPSTNWVRMKTPLITVFTAVLLSACSTTATRVASIQLTTTPEATFELLRSQALKCWPTVVTPVKKGMKVEARQVSETRSVIEVHPVHWNYGAEKRVFVTVAVEPAPGGSSVTVDEGGHSCTMFQGCPPLGLKVDVQNWIAGDLSCKDFSSQLIRLGVGV